MRVAVLGAGAWGTAMAVAAARRHEVLLWARDAAHIAQLAQTRRNSRYLPEVALPPGLRCTADLEQALAHGDGGGRGEQRGLTLLATPTAALRDMLAIAVRTQSAPALWWLCKGFEAGTGALGHEVAQQVLAGSCAAQPDAANLKHSLAKPRAPTCFGMLSGPSFALEVARGQPTALVAASADEALREQAVAAFHGDGLRVYSSVDLVGAEVGGAVKNVLAIAVGALDGLQLGLNARAALITRGLAEMSRLGLALGARAETFMGLSGLGDLVLTTTGELSRNRRVGLLLAQGKTVDQAVAELGHVAEGVLSAPVVLARAESLGVEMPITQAVVQVLSGALSLRAALVGLMARDAKAEA